MKWCKETIDQDFVKGMARRYGIDTLTASILARRKITEPSQVRYFLEGDPRHLHNPFLFHAMEDAVDRILLAADEGEKVMVFGDSDTDGVTSTTLMVEALAQTGLEASWRVPEGEEPYGLSMGAVEEFAESGGTLMLTVDCGISNHEEVRRAAELGIDVIICDHHRLQAENPPEALAVIDPKIEGCGYPFRELAGAGVAWKLAEALAFARSELYKLPIALLYIAEEPVQPGGESPKRWSIQASKLHNLVETGRFSESVEEGSPRVTALLQKLAGFLAGRTIFTWGRKEQLLAVRSLFGGSVDIEFLDMATEIVAADPGYAGKSPEELSHMLGTGRYSSSETGSLDVLFDLLALLARNKAFGRTDPDGTLLQLAALGTIADLMPLKDENRIIVRRGVASISSSPRKGLKELLAALGIARTLSSTEIAWQVTPLLNAAGRIGKPGIALSLLMENDQARRAKSVEEIIQANNERKRMGTDSWEAIYPLAGASFEQNEHRYVLVGSPFIKSGITGLLASRVVGTFKVPAIVAAFRENGIIVGSIRTANGYRISSLLSECSDLFLDYGGHDAAAGFSMPKENWDRFVERAGNQLKAAETAAAEESISIDAELPHSYLRPELQKIHARFEPYGEENRPLVFLARGVPMVDAQIVGKSSKSHLKLTLDFGTYKWPAMLWDGAERLERDFSFKAKDRLDLLFKLSLNRWNGEEKPQLELYDVRREGSNQI